MVYPSFKDVGLCDYDDGICDSFNPGDVGFNMDNIDELFGCTQTKNPFPEGGLDGFLMDKNFSVADSNGHIEKTVEVSSNPCISLVVHCRVLVTKPFMLFELLLFSGMSIPRIYQTFIRNDTS